MQGALSVFLITLGIGQLLSTGWGLRGASLAGPNRRMGYLLGLALLAGGGVLLPQTAWVLLWTPLAGLLALALLLWGGSYIGPLPHPNALFSGQHPAHGGCRAVEIVDGDHLMPGLLLGPPDGGQKINGAAVCIVPGAGDTKISFKWRLVKALLAHGFTVLTIDPPGHGQYRHRPLSYPDCLSAIPAAVQFLRAQPEIERVGVIGISLGGAMTLRALAEQSTGGDCLIDALAIVATPTRLNYTKALFYGELWRTVFGAPSLWLLREATLKQIRESWYTGGYRSRHSTAQLFELLNPVESIKRLRNLPVLLVYSRRDLVAPPEQAEAMRRAAPQARFAETTKASHVMLTLMPEVNFLIAGWLKEQIRSN